MKQKYYQCNDFLFESMPDPIDVAIDKKVSLLYDLCILVMHKKDRDARETTLREVLAHYNSERALTTALHDIVLGNKSLDTFLAQKGVM